MVASQNVHSDNWQPCIMTCLLQMFKSTITSRVLLLAFCQIFLSIISNETIQNKNENDQKLDYDKFHEALNDDYVGKKSVLQSSPISLFMSPPNLVTLMTEKMKVF